VNFKVVMIQFMSYYSINSLKGRNWMLIT